MPRTLLCPLILVLSGCFAMPALFSNEKADSKAKVVSLALVQWPQWRGPLGTGVAPKANPPVTWSESSNVVWKIALPGKGHASPVIWDESIFVTAAVPHGDALEPKYSGRPGAHDNLPVTHRQKFVLLAVDRADGTILWEKTLHEALPHEGGHYTATLASASPVTDGEHVFAFFGSYGLYCLTPDGDIVWQKQLGKMHTKHGHGEGSSPVLHGDTLVVNWDHEEQSFVVAFEKATGKPRWKKMRDEVTSWATPIVVEHDGKAQLIVCGTDRVRGYDLSDGSVIWECGGLSANICASPVAANGIVYAGSSYEKRAILAIRLEGATGDITHTKNVVWKRRSRTPYVPSPLLYDDALYYLRHYQPIMTRVSAPTGHDEPGAFRLEELRDVYASPVAAAGRVYVTDRYGLTIVLKNDTSHEVLARNQLDDAISASAALVGDRIFLRGERFLYCIGQTPKKAAE